MLLCIYAANPLALRLCVRALFVCHMHHVLCELRTGPDQVWYENVCGCVAVRLL